MQRKLNTEDSAKCRKAAALLHMAFCWKDTPEGESYWSEVYALLIRKGYHGTSDGKPWQEPVNDPNPVVSHVDLPKSVLRLIAIGLVVEKYTNSRGFEFVDERLSLEEAGRHVSELVSQSNAAAFNPEEQPRPSRPAQITPINP